MKYSFKYGKGIKTIAIPDKADVTELKPTPPPALPDIVQAAEQVLNSPIDFPGFEGRPSPKSAAIAIPDESRPVPFRDILPVVIRRLLKAYPKLSPQDITIVIGGGLHPPMDNAAAARWLPPDVAPGCPIVMHDAQNSPLVEYGRTRQGTPVAVNAEYAAAELKIVIGQVDPHQFVGFTGGAKGVVVGCASEAAIESNHALMFKQGAQVGKLDGNPVREDLNEAGRLAGVDLAVNVVMNPEKQAVGLWAGAPESVLRKASEVCAKVYGAPVKEKFDIAVASCGGYPKDICLYQAQKGLNLASHAVKPGGMILLLASCDQGVGDDVYYNYVRRFKTAEEALEDFKNGDFKMGAHKSFLFGRTITNYKVVVDSELESGVLSDCHLQAGSAGETIESWINDFPGRPRTAIVPNANTTYFYPA